MKGERQHIRPAGHFNQQGVGGGRLGTTFGGKKFHDNRLIGERRGEQVPQRQSNHDYAQHYFFLSRRFITKKTLSPPLIAGDYTNLILERCITTEEREADSTLC
jgi:hypothetical protein